MTCIARHVIVTLQSHGRAEAWTRHRCKRIAKKWGQALIMRPDALQNMRRTISILHALRGYVDITERCERQIGRYLRRSGLAIKVYPRAQVDDMMRTGTWPPSVAR